MKTPILSRCFEHGRIRPGHRFLLKTWALCVAVLVCATGRAQAPAPASEQVFIQGSEVNLRDKPSASAKVVGKVTIGTECQHVKDAPKEWVRVRCGEVEGFTLKSLVGAQKPTVEALLAQAADTAQAAKARLDAAMRAATLAPENTQTRELLGKGFFDVSFEQLLKDRDKGGLHETFKVMRTLESSYPAVKHESGEAALLRELEKREYDWHRFERRGSDFVSAMYRDGALIVYAGSFGSMDWMEIDDDDKEFLVSIESRSSSEVSESLKRALQQGARLPTPDARKYSDLHQESPDMPALSAQSLRLYQSLPDQWYRLSQTQAGERFLDTGCGLKGVELRVDLHRRASVWWHLFQGPGESNDEVLRVVSVVKTATGFQFQLRGRGGYQKTLTLTWPTAEAKVSRWDVEPHGSPSYYLVANTRHRFRVDDSPCGGAGE